MSSSALRRRLLCSTTDPAGIERDRRGWQPTRRVQATYWRRHVREPVQFFAGMRALARLGLRLVCGDRSAADAGRYGKTVYAGYRRPLAALAPPRPRRLAADA